MIIIANCPSWFSLMWKIIKPMVNERTRKKVRIVGKSETFAAICEFVDPENVPTCYGGQLRCVLGRVGHRWVDRYRESQPISELTHHNQFHAHPETHSYGEDPDSCRWNSPEEVALSEFVHAVNRKHGVASKMQ